MILALKTNQDPTEIHLLDQDGQVVREKVWSAGRELAHDLLSEVEQLIDGKFGELTGLIVFAGPGSFTGLRIGITTMNTIAYSQNIPIVGTNGKNWWANGLKRLKLGENDKIALPEYGAAPNITSPKK